MAATWSGGLSSSSACYIHQENPSAAVVWLENHRYNFIMTRKSLFLSCRVYLRTKLFLFSLGVISPFFEHGVNAKESLEIFDLILAVLQDE